MFNLPFKAIVHHCFNLMQLAILLGWMESERACKDGDRAEKIIGPLGNYYMRTNWGHLWLVSEKEINWVPRIS